LYSKDKELQLVGLSLLEAQEQVSAHPLTVTMVAHQMVEIALYQMRAFGLTNFLIARRMNSFAVNGQEASVSRPEILSAILPIEDVTGGFLKIVWPELPSAVCSIFTRRLNTVERLFDVVLVEAMTQYGFHIAIKSYRGPERVNDVALSGDDGSESADIVTAKQKVVDSHAWDW